MQKLYDEVGSLDQRCYDEFGLNIDILTEHAANGMATFIRSKFPKNSKILVVCGAGNNGGDGITLSRLLFHDYDVHLFMIKDPKSQMAISQYKRVHAIGMKQTIEINSCDVLVDALFGTGFDGRLDAEAKSVMQAINKRDAYKIACDIPSGLRSNGECDEHTFVADVTLTMGALKKSMYSDQAKGFLGEVKVLDLGISRSLYEVSSNWNLLDEEDLELPSRKAQDTHKGNYGHLSLTCGDKSGASFMSGLAALKFGVGQVTMISHKGEPLNIPYSLTFSNVIAQKSTALACGMGLGSAFSDEELNQFLDNELPLVVDADMFYLSKILDILKRKNVVLTPHAKEFVSLLKISGLAEINMDELHNNRLQYCEEFCKKYPNVTLLLKGSNVVIGQNDKFYINPHGSSALAKGGSGDILSGLVAALLAQGHDPLKASINASLEHTKVAKEYKGADFSLTPEDLIQGIGNL